MFVALNKNNQRLSMKLGGRMQYGSTKNPLYFRVDPDHGADLMGLLMKNIRQIYGTDISIIV